MKRLFIDPATYDTGWALFDDNGELLQSGKIQVKSGRLFERLLALKNEYRDLAAWLKPDSVHIERMNHRVHTCIWSVAAILVGVEEAGVPVDDKNPDFQISPNSWQAKVRWKRADSLAEYRGEVESIDQLAAIGMGVFYFMKREAK